MVRRSLANLINHAESVVKGAADKPYSHTFEEFNRVGLAFASMLKSLRERDNRIAGIIDHSPGIIFIKDKNHRYLLHNQQFALAVGRNPAEIDHLTDKELFPAHLVKQLSHTDDYVLEHSESIQFEFNLQTPAGERTFLSSKFPLLDDNGAPYAVGGIATDITERKQAEDHLRLSQQVFEAAAEAFLVFDDQGHFITCNRTFRQMTGLNDTSPNTAIQAFLESHPYIQAGLKTAGYWKGESEFKQQHGANIPVLISVSQVHISTSNYIHYVAVISDITALKQAEYRLEKLAHFDSLTSLPNRSLFFERLQHALNQSARNGSRMALLFLDVDRFKSINDTYGHDTGDQLLVQVSKQLKTCIRRSDTLSRLGGDEFTVILTNVNQPGLIERSARRLLASLAEPIYTDSNIFHISGSLGIAIYPEDGQDCHTLLKHADIAMYHAKDNGRNSFQFFDSTLNTHSQTRIYIEENLHEALKSKELFIEYQPRFDMSGQCMTGAEALIRWRHPEKGLIPPSEFIPVAENSDLIITIGRFVLNEACYTAKQWLDNGHQVPVSVNLSPQQLHDPHIISDIQQALKNSQLPPDHLELEITETQVIDNIDQVSGTLTTLRQMGVRLSVDDFGTGYSSLIYLKKLPFNTVKIDRSFVADVPGDSDDEILIGAIISMSHSLNLSVVAEGVETAEQLAFLKALGCNEIQGFLLAKPGSPEQLITINKPD